MSKHTCCRGLLPEYCAACQRESADAYRAELPAERRAWLDLCDRHPWLARECGYPLHEPIPPQVSVEEATVLVTVLRDPRYSPALRDVLRELLRPVLAKAIAVAVAAALEERRAG